MTAYFAADGGTIAYEVAGSGPLIVLAHGMGDSRAAYRAVIPPLTAAGHRVAAVDLRGCGESGVDWSACGPGTITTGSPPDAGRTNQPSRTVRRTHPLSTKHLSALHGGVGPAMSHRRIVRPLR